MAETDYTDLDIQRGLEALAEAGSVRKASEITKSTGRQIPYRTLQDWKRKHKDRLEQIRSEEVERSVGEAASRWAYALRSRSDIAEAAAQELSKRLEADPNAFKNSELYNLVKSLDIAGGVATDKMMQLTGRPTQVIERRTYVEAVNLLERLGVVEGTAEEIPPEGLPEGDREAEGASDVTPD